MTQLITTRGQKAAPNSNVGRGPSKLKVWVKAKMPKINQTTASMTPWGSDGSCVCRLSAMKSSRSLSFCNVKPGSMVTQKNKFANGPLAYPTGQASGPGLRIQFPPAYSPGRTFLPIFLKISA